MALGLVVPYSTYVWLERGQSSDPLFCPFVSVNPGKTSPQQAPAAFSLNVHPDPFLTLLCRRDRLSPARENCLATTVFSTNAVLRGICHYSGYCHKYRWLRHTSARAVLLQELLGWRLHQMVCCGRLQDWQLLLWKYDKTKGCSNSSKLFVAFFPMPYFKN